MTSLDDNLDDIFPASTDLRADLPAKRLTPEQVTRGAHWEACRKCQGTGQTRWGTCFSCHGQRGRSFKTDAATRAKARGKAQAKRISAAQEGERQRDIWIDAHKAEVDFLKAKVVEVERRGGAWAFPADMLTAIAKWNALTDNQLAAVRRMMAADTERQAAREAQKAAAPAIDMTKVVAAINMVRGEARKDGEGVRWPRVTIGEFRFTEMPANGQWEACIFVKRGADKLGRVIGGKFHRFRACDDATESAVIAAALDPSGTAKAFGQRTGTCCCCGRELTNEDSRKNGIGPICASKHGW